MLSLSHKNLAVWKQAIDFVTQVYRITEKFPKDELYGLTNQLRRAAVSVPSNIAEGASRKPVKDRRRFYEIARSSLVEIDTQLEISVKLGLMKESGLSDVYEELNHLFALISNLIQSTR